MQHCLICGAASWGPAKPGFVVSGDFQVQLTEADTAKWRQCDACGSLAQAGFIEKEPEREPDADFGPSPLEAIFAGIKEAASAPSPMDKMTERLAALFETRMPVPETRLERIIKAIIRSQGRDGSSQSTETWAWWLARAGHAIELAMDKISTGDVASPTLSPAPGFIFITTGSGHAFQFVARYDFVNWMASILDRTRPGFGQGWNSKEWADAIATELEGRNEP